jgi:ribosomal protein S2
VADLDALLKDLAEASDVIASLDRERAAAVARRDAVLRAARAAGATWVRMREITGMSPNTISKALRP